MKIDLKTRLSNERLNALKKSPKVMRLEELHGKIRSGEATAFEKVEWREKTDWVKKLPGNVLSERHRPLAEH